MHLYHVLNRGVDKRDIVIDEKDRVRFVHDLFVLNDARSVDPNYGKRFESLEYIENFGKRNILVRIHAFCLMTNHYHLLLEEVTENGIARFMHKLNKSYSRYFNEKYKRTGTLWQGTYKKILIENDAHSLYIPYYIHLNPLDFKMPEWRDGRVKDMKRAQEILNSYRWSSHMDYCGIRNFPSITYRDYLAPQLGPKNKYEKEIASIISDASIASLSGLIE